MKDQLIKIEKQFSQLENKLQDPQVIGDKSLYNRIISEFSKLKPIAELYRELKKLQKDLEDNQKMLQEDSEISSLAKEEIKNLNKKIQDIELQLKKRLEPKDPLDEKNIILELRSGAGGLEAGLFCRELFQAYEKYADLKKWNVEVLSCSVLETGGFREMIAKISGSNVYGSMKFESGIHRVQRVPETESQGRVHTSTVTTAVLPEAQQKEVSIRQEDLRIDSCRSSGAGGQHVNTTDSAVRIVHLPSRTTVYCQEEKSQRANKEKAFKILYAKLLAQELEKKRKKESQIRLGQIGSGDRSEKIRTYNFPQSRVTDHRISLTLHSLDRIMKGEMDLLIIPLIEKSNSLKKREP